jgi:hypothetical protein
MQNKLQNITLILMVLVITVLSIPTPANAIPVFARKYGFECTMCHSNFPRLNDFGQRFRQNGYQLPGRENEEKTVLETPAPIAFRATAGYNRDEFKNTPGSTDVSEFQISSLDLLSGGLIGENIGYFLIYPPDINASRGVAGQTGNVEVANVIFSNILPSTEFNIRVGRFEPEYVPVSVKRSLSVSPYEIYDFSPTGGSPFSNSQEGIELTGYSPHGFGFAAGVLNGSSSSNINGRPTDYYLRLQQVFGQGEGQTAGQKVGLTGYFGKAHPGDLASAPKESFNRIGLDASLNIDHFNLALQYLQGQDDAALWGTARNVTFNGGFAELSYLPRTDLVFFGRYDMVNTPSILNQDIRGFTLGTRYYFEDNLALHLEVSQRTQQLTSLVDSRENFITARLDFAF